jgi:hypothetical protein
MTESHDRRDMLKLRGFGLAAGVIDVCDRGRSL